MYTKKVVGSCRNVLLRRIKYVRDSFCVTRVYGHLRETSHGIFHGHFVVVALGKFLEPLRSCCAGSIELSER